MHEGSMLRRCILLHADTAMLLAAKVEGGLAFGWCAEALPMPAHRASSQTDCHEGLVVYASIDLMQMRFESQMKTEDRPAARHISRHVCRRPGVVHQQGAMLACAPVLARQRHHAARGCLHACSAHVRLRSKLTAALADRNCKWQHSCVRTGLS